MPAIRRSPRVHFAGALLLIAIAGLAAFAYRVRQTQHEEVAEPASGDSSSPIELDRFSARLEKSDNEERLLVGLWLRASVGETMECFTFVVARTDRSTPKVWSIWPSTSPGLAISAGGHFHAAHPASGFSVALGDSWERIDAVLPVTPGQPAFDSVVVYVVGANGNILLARPFAL